MKSENQKQQFEFYLFMAEMVKLLIEEYKQKPTEECFASIDAMILELKEWLIFMMSKEDITTEFTFAEE